VSSGAQAHDDPGPRDAHSALSSADALLGGGVRRILQIQAGGDYCDTDELTFPLLVDETDAGGTTDPTVVHHSYDILASVGKIRSGCQSRRRAATGPTLEFRPDSLSTEIHFPRGAVLPSGVAHLWDPSISIPVDGPRQR
jgi:hypothetical protein